MRRHKANGQSSGARRGMAIAVALGLAVSITWTQQSPASPQVPPAQENARPNILVIVTDDQRVDTMRVLPKTQRWFGDEGVEFTQAFATTPLCCPSRATIMSGRYPHNHGVRRNGEAGKLDQKQTIQALLQTSGYSTAMAGKYLNGWKPQQAPAFFDRWSLLVPPDDADSYLKLDTDGYYGTPFNNDGALRRIDQYSTDFIASKGVEFLNDFEKDDDQPWFVYLAPYSPHEPYTPRHDLAKASVPSWSRSAAVGEKNLDDKPDWVRSHPITPRQGAALRRKQLRNLMSVDDLVDDVMSELETLNEDEETLAIFLSDNGYMWGEHGLHRKQYPYTETIQVPLFLRWPGELQPGSTDGGIAATIDIAPTVLEAAGLTLPLADGRSLLGGTDRDLLLLEYWIKEQGDEPPDWASLRTLEYQYIEYYSAFGSVLFREYYDLDADPFQMSNILKDGDGRNDPDVDALSGLLESLSDCRGAECP